MDPRHFIHAASGLERQCGRDDSSDQRDNVGYCDTLAPKNRSEIAFLNRQSRWPRDAGDIAMVGHRGGHKSRVQNSFNFN